MKKKYSHLRDKAIPEILSGERFHHFHVAESSKRKRSPKILHKQGDYLNRVFNFILEESYMHPHLHPGVEKIEKMYLIEGAFGLIIFNNEGEITETIVMEQGDQEYTEVPAFTWHTYVMLTDKVIVYETMEGEYDPSSWKEMAAWAPAENSEEAIPYLQMLKAKFT